MKATAYFNSIKSRPDRAIIKMEWILLALENPERTEVQLDGRIKHWVKIKDFGNRWLRVVTLEDGITVHNAFFDRKMGVKK